MDKIKTTLYIQAAAKPLCQFSFGIFPKIIMDDIDIVSQIEAKSTIEFADRVYFSRDQKRRAICDTVLGGILARKVGCFSALGQEMSD